MGFVTSYRVSPEVDTVEIPNIPYSRHILPSKRKSGTPSSGNPKPHRCIQWMLQTFCEFSSNYPTLLRSLSDPATLSRSGKIIQFPFSQPSVDEKTEEDQARLTERRKEQGKRLQEMAAKARMEKVSAPYMTVNRARHGCCSWKPKRGICARCWS